VLVAFRVAVDCGAGGLAISSVVKQLVCEAKLQAKTPQSDGVMRFVFQPFAGKRRA
jgi:hypothetical protein